MSLVNHQNQTVKSFPPLKVRNFAVYGHVHVLISISETKETPANVFVCIFYTFFSFLCFFLTCFSFLFSKVSNLKDMLAFYHLSHKLKCVFV